MSCFWLVLLFGLFVLGLLIWFTVYASSRSSSSPPTSSCAPISIDPHDPSIQPYILDLQDLVPQTINETIHTSMDKLSPVNIGLDGFGMFRMSGLNNLSVNGFTITRVEYDPCPSVYGILTISTNVILNSPRLGFTGILGTFEITRGDLSVKDVVLTIRINKTTLQSTVIGVTIGSYTLTGTGSTIAQDLINVLNGFQGDILGLLRTYVFSGLPGLDLSMLRNDLVGTSRNAVGMSPSPYQSLANLLIEAVNNGIAQYRTDKTSISFFSGCPAGTIDRIPLCGNIDQNGSLEVGGSAPCYAAYGVCYAACSPAIAACEICKPIPFISCGGVCNGADNCTRGCTRARDDCVRALMIDWNLHIESLNNLGSLHLSSATNLRSVNQGSDVLVFFTVTGTVSPQAQVTLRATGFDTYNGLVNLGNLTFSIEFNMAFNCPSRQIVSVSIQTLTVDGVNVVFQSPVSNIYPLIRSVLNSKVKGALQNNLKDFLNRLIRGFLPITSPIGCI